MAGGQAMALTQGLWLQWAFPGGPHDEAGAHGSPQGPQKADRPGTAVSCPGLGGLPAPKDSRDPARGGTSSQDDAIGPRTLGPQAWPALHLTPATAARVNPEQGAEQKRGRQSSVTLGPFRKPCFPQRSRGCLPHPLQAHPPRTRQPHWPGALHRGRVSSL
uniref:Proline-rich protein 2-like n=1 Tax=Callorhinus ursinus TaxID=34884 RepID=A0A3Q7NLQ8_CALUR|nr:proline-rich protein 2-like [Callorhinus ursinus]